MIANQTLDWAFHDQMDLNSHILSRFFENILIVMSNGTYEADRLSLIIRILAYVLCKELLKRSVEKLN